MLSLVARVLHETEYVVCTSTYTINDKPATYVEICPSPAKCVEVAKDKGLKKLNGNTPTDGTGSYCNIGSLANY